MSSMVAGSGITTGANVVRRLNVVNVCDPVKPAFGTSPGVPETVVEVPMVSLARYALVLIKLPTKSMLLDVAADKPKFATVNENVKGPVPLPAKPVFATKPKFDGVLKLNNPAKVGSIAIAYDGRKPAGNDARVRVELPELKPEIAVRPPSAVSVRVLVSAIPSAPVPI